MYKLASETLQTHPENKELQIFDRCLLLTNEASRKASLGYLLLARLVSSCSPQVLRLMQSRLGKKFSNVSKRFSLPGAMFVREMLVRNPQSGELHSEIVQDIVMKSIDTAVISGDEVQKQLAAELFARHTGVSGVIGERLLNTLNDLLNSSTLLSRKEMLLPLLTLGVSIHRTTLISVLFECLSTSLSLVTKPEVTVSRNDILRVIESGVREEATRKSALLCLRSLCYHAKTSFVPLLPRVVSMLMSRLSDVDQDLVRTISFISRVFGPVTSTVYKHFYVLPTALKQPFDERYGRHVGDLFASIIEGAAHLIKPEVFLTVQRSIAEVAFQRPTSSSYLQIMAAFMSSTNEFVPPPIQIAQAICARIPRQKFFECEYARNLRMLCQITCRPRILGLNMSELRRVVALQALHNPMLKISERKPDFDFSMKDDVIEPTNLAASNESNVDDNDDICIIESTQQIVATESSIVSIETVKKLKRPAEESVQRTLPKKLAPPQPTELRQGEPTVCEILDSFDVS